MKLGETLWAAIYKQSGNKDCSSCIYDEVEMLEWPCTECKGQYYKPGCIIPVKGAKGEKRGKV